MFAQAVAVFQQQQVLVRNVLRADRLHPRQTMVAGADDEEAVEREILGLDIAERDRQRENRGVDFSRFEATEQRRSLLLAEIDSQVRRGLTQTRQHARQKVRRNGWNHAELNRP